MSSKLMTKLEAEGCIFEQLDINASNADIFERILNLPYEIYVETVNRLCSGELSIDDFDKRLFESEKNIDSSASLYEIDVDELAKGNIGVANSLEGSFKTMTNLGSADLQTEGVFTNPAFETGSFFTGSAEGDLIAGNAITKMDKSLLPGTNDILVSKLPDDEIKKAMSLDLYLETSDVADLLLNGRNTKFALDTDEMKQLSSKKGLLERQIKELEMRRDSGNKKTALSETTDKLVEVNNELERLSTERANIEI